MILSVSSEKEILKIIRAVARECNRQYYGVSSMEEFENFKTNEKIDVIIFYSHLNGKKTTVLAQDAHKYIVKHYNKPVVIITTNKDKNIFHDDLKVYKAPLSINDLKDILL